jgi:hypothetical protein
MLALRSGVWQRCRGGQSVGSYSEQPSNEMAGRAAQVYALTPALRLGTSAAGPGRCSRSGRRTVLEYPLCRLSRGRSLCPPVVQMPPGAARHVAFAYSDMATSRILRKLLKTTDWCTVYSAQKQAKGVAGFDTKPLAGAHLLRSIWPASQEPRRRDPRLRNLPRLLEIHYTLEVVRTSLGVI